MKKRIYLLIEILKREIDARILFAKEASNLGYSVVIGHKGVLWERLKYLRPGVVIFKSIGPRNTEMMKKLKSYGHHVAAYDEEMFINYDIKDAVERRIYPKSLNVLDYFFCWGDDDKNEMLKSFPNNKNIFFSTGNPRVDILKRQNRHIFNDEIEKIKNKYGNFILLTSSFSKINENQSEGKIGHVFNMVAMGKSIMSRELEVARNWRSLLQLDLEYYIKFILNFDKYFPEKKLIIRPHPAENEKFWIELTKNLKNVFTVSDSKSTNSWILASDLLIGHNDTTIIEASIMEKPVVNYVPCQNFPSVEYSVLKQFTIPVRSEEQLINIINKKNYEDHITKVKNVSEVKLYLNNFEENQSSTKKIIDQIKLREHEFNNIKTVDKYNNKLFYVYYDIKSNIKKLIKKLLFFRSVDEREETRKKQKFGDGISLNILKYKFFKLIGNKYKKSYKINKIFPHIFLIEKKDNE